MSGFDAGLDDDELADFTDRINWPEGLDESIFLKDYWQQKPLLIRQAFPDFETPLPADELAGLSLDADASSRIITQDDNGDYFLEHGPFEEDRFTSLNSNNWSLLVTDIEKLLPEFKLYLQPFRFIPDWRIDDLMVSYAPDGASVGAHIDEYDVFLLQASGTRTWHIDSRPDTVHELKKTSELKILANFSSTHTWDLQPGDMLYLPPNMAHHGVAKGDDCMSWSIGFRAPLISDMINRLAELVSEEMPHQRYTDGLSLLTMPTLPAAHGEINAASVSRFKALWTQAMTMSDAQFAQLLGRWLTEPAQLAPDVVAEDKHTPSVTSGDHPVRVNKSSFSRFAWHTNSNNEAALFVDGHCYQCSLQFASIICEQSNRIELHHEQFNAADISVFDSLLRNGSLQYD